MRKATLVPAAVLAGLLSLLVASPAGAAKQQGPTGTIELMAAEAPAAASSAAVPSAYAYGDSVEFETTLEGRVSSKAIVYVTVVCMQDGDVVYQYSGDRQGSFPLADQAGLEWNGGDASCEAWLIYRVEKGRSAEITMLDMVAFDVVGS